MITGPLKAKIDKLWEEFWTGGITNPLTVIEQISFLAFARLLDIRESTDEKKWRRLHPGRPFKGAFGPGEQELRWQNFSKLGGEAMLPLVRDKVFPHFRTLGARGRHLRRVHAGRPADDPEAEPARLGREHDREAAADERRHQGRPLRVPAQQADHRRDQRPVPHAAAHHPA